MDEYPIFDEAYRAGLNKKIVDHYAHHEIGQESVDMFIHAFKRKMNEIMPMFNQLYVSERMKIDPLNTMSIKTVAAGANESVTDNKAESENTTRTSAAGQVVSSEFPQTQLQRRKDYASSGSDSTNVGESAGGGKEASNVKATAKDENESATTGWQGSQAMLLMQYRATFLNIDMDIINALPELFMWVWNNGDQYTNNINGQGYPYYG
jgi:hypothetical protein